jgi:single-stranded DNA-specific DHH superfamily exonuclease
MRLAGPQTPDSEYCCGSPVRTSADPENLDSNDLAFGVAPRINASGRIGHPARALLVFEAGSDTVVAKIEKRS